MTLRRGDRGDAVKRLQQGLTQLGYKPGTADGIFGPKTEAAVEAFQKALDLYTDGIAGVHTLTAFNAEMKARYQGSLDCSIDFKHDTDTEPSGPGDEKLKWVKCPADKFEDRGGYSSTRLREDTAVAYNKLYDAVHELGGIVTSAGGKRRLTSKAGANRSKKSMHYTGRAFDMALPTGLKDPDVDPFIIVRDGDSRYWTVWCVSSLTPSELQTACSRIHPSIEGGLMALEGTYLRGRKVKSKMATRVVFNFTALAKSFGFDRIPARRSFFSRGTYGGAEWWHFQWETGLIKGHTTFGYELQRVYTLEQCKRFVYWNQVKNCVYGVNWF